MVRLFASNDPMFVLVFKRLQIESLLYHKHFFVRKKLATQPTTSNGSNLPNLTISSFANELQIIDA